jgi:hypothetical protein
MTSGSRILEIAMTFGEKALYHQIHPAKLATDIATEFVSLYFLWQHQLVLGLVAHFAPPILASALLIAFGDFETQKFSGLGRYISWHMTRAVEAARLIGDIVMVFGAWYRQPLIIAAGLFIVLAAWSCGALRRRTQG